MNERRYDDINEYIKTYNIYIYIFIDIDIHLTCGLQWLMCFGGVSLCLYVSMHPAWHREVHSD